MFIHILVRKSIFHLDIYIHIPMLGADGMLELFMNELQSPKDGFDDDSFFELKA